jgi:hypothetical protein
MDPEHYQEHSLRRTKPHIGAQIETLRFLDCLLGYIYFDVHWALMCVIVYCIRIAIYPAVLCANQAIEIGIRTENLCVGFIFSIIFDLSAAHF